MNNPEGKKTATSKVGPTQTAEPTTKRRPRRGKELGRPSQRKNHEKLQIIAYLNIFTPNLFII